MSGPPHDIIKLRFTMLFHYNDFPRFWSKVAIGAPDECWPWIACINKKGYGHFRLKGRLNRAHRVAYELITGLIPAGLTIDHLCRNRKCVNPQHLEAVTMKTNTLRGESPAALNAKKTHCKRGHPFDEANTIIELYGARRCRECHNQSRRGLTR